MLISYENKWVWLPHLTNLSKGVVDLLIPFEDELMWLPHAKCYSDGVVDVWSFLKISWCDYTIQFHSTYLAEALVDLWSFLKISWCDYTIQHICRRGGKFLIPFEYKTYKLMLLPHSTGDDDHHHHYDDGGEIMMMVMMMMVMLMMMMMVMMMIVSVEQRTSGLDGTTFRRTAHHLPHSLHGVGWGGVEWSGVGMSMFPWPCSHDHAQDVDATLTWGGVGWGGNVNVPSATFPRPCTRCWYYAHMGWGGGGCERSFDCVPSTLHKMLMLRSHGVGQGGVGMLTFLRPLPSTLRKMLMLRSHGVGWGCYNVPSATFPRPFARCCCYARMGWGGVGC